MLFFLGVLVLFWIFQSKENSFIQKSSGFFEKKRRFFFGFLPRLIIFGLVHSHRASFAPLQQPVQRPAASLLVGHSPAVRLECSPAAAALYPVLLHGTQSNRPTGNSRRTDPGAWLWSVYRGENDQTSLLLVSYIFHIFPWKTKIIRYHGKQERCQYYGNIENTIGSKWSEPN